MLASVQEYASLGHQQREHLNAMGFLKEVIAVIDSFDGRDKLDVVLVLMELTSLLTRRQARWHKLLTMS